MVWQAADETRCSQADPRTHTSRDATPKIIRLGGLLADAQLVCKLAAICLHRPLEECMPTIHIGDRHLPVLRPSVGLAFFS